MTVLAIIGAFALVLLAVQAVILIDQSSEARKMELRKAQEEVAYLSMSIKELRKEVHTLRYMRGSALELPPSPAPRPLRNERPITYDKLPIG